jgi:TRAP-type C4-dicarboxylate transport system permease small subunit
MSWIEKMLNYASKALLAVTMLCLGLMMAHVIADVVLSGLFSQPIPGTSEVVAYYYMIGAVFLPIPLVEMRRASIQVDLFYNIVNNNIKKIMLVAAYLAQFVFFILMARQTGLDAFESFIKSEYVQSQIQIYVWPGRFFLPLGFGLGAIISLFHLIKYIISPAWSSRTRISSGQ